MLLVYWLGASSHKHLPFKSGFHLVVNVVSTWKWVMWQSIHTYLHLIWLICIQLTARLYHIVETNFVTTVTTKWELGLRWPKNFSCSMTRCIIWDNKLIYVYKHPFRPQKSISLKLTDISRFQNFKKLQTILVKTLTALLFYLKFYLPTYNSYSTHAIMFSNIFIVRTYLCILLKLQYLNGRQRIFMYE